MKLTRQESLQIHPKRHPMDVTLTTACDENGILVGMKCEVVSDTGAYASLGGPVLERACTHAAGPYNYQMLKLKVLQYTLITLHQEHLEVLELLKHVLQLK